MSALGGFGRGGEDGFWKFFCLAEIGVQRDPADLPRLLVRAPSAADQIPAGDAFDGERLELAHYHAAEL